MPTCEGQFVHPGIAGSAPARAYPVSGEKLIAGRGELIRVRAIPSQPSNFSLPLPRNHFVPTNLTNSSIDPSQHCTDFQQTKNEDSITSSSQSSQTHTELSYPLRSTGRPSFSLGSQHRRRRSSSGTAAEMQRRRLRRRRPRFSCCSHASLPPLTLSLSFSLSLLYVIPLASWAEFGGWAAAVSVVSVVRRC